jgi:hypothetical protein
MPAKYSQGKHLERPESEKKFGHILAASYLGWEFLVSGFVFLVLLVLAIVNFLPEADPPCTLSIGGRV